MTPYAINKAICDHLDNSWTATSIREINRDDAPALPFIEPYFKPGQMAPLEIKGAGERVGVFMINIFTKKGVGVQEGLVYGGLLETMFTHVDIDGVYCENSFLLPYTNFIGIDEELQACHHQTIIPFSVVADL